MVATVTCPDHRLRTTPQSVSVGHLKNDLLLTHAYYLSLTRNEKKMMQPYAPLGPLYVAAYLRQKGFRVQFYDTTFAGGIADFARYLDRCRPPLVGISVFETTRRNAREMINECRRRGIAVVVGGPDPSAEPEYYLQQGARMVVVGEGEETMAELLGALRSGGDTDGIRGLATPRGFAGRRPLIGNLDELPFPAHDSIDYRPYFGAWKKKHGITSLQLSVSRGCPYRCSWCAKPVFGSSRRMRSAKNLVEEMQFVKMLYNPDMIRFADDIFGDDRDWVRAFKDEVLNKRARIPFECFSRVDLADDDTVAALKDAGCVRIWYGVESGSQKILERMRMDFNVDDVRKTAALTRRAGIEVGFYVMLGHPSEEIADVELTRRLIRETRPDRCDVSIAYPHKGSRLYREVECDMLPVRYGDRVENENILTFKSRYSQNFYDTARKCIGRESRLRVQAQAPLTARVAYGACRLGYRIMRSGIR